MSALALVAHLSTAELGQRYRAARQPIERSHLQIVWLASQGRSEREVALVTGHGRRWIAEIVRRYDTAGPAGLGDRRNRNAGAKSLLDEQDKAALDAALAAPPADGGLWTGPKDGQRRCPSWMAARLGRKVWPQRGWDYLHKLGHRSQVPRPRHAKAASAEEQEAFKRGSPAGWTSAAPRTPSGRSRSGRSTVESGAFNRVGLKPILRRPSRALARVPDDRDRGRSRDLTPPTPPCVRGRARRFVGSSCLGDQ
jgi:transposase